MQIPCPQCGARLPLQPDDRFLLCEFCSAWLLVVAGKTLRPVVFAPVLERKEAAERLLAGGTAQEVGLDDIETQLVHIPYWEDGPVLRLACSSLEVSESLPGTRTKPGGASRFQEGADEGLELLPPDPRPSEEENRPLLYLPAFRMHWKESEETRRAVVDAMDGTVYGLESQTVQTVQITRDAPWLFAIVFVPPILGFLGGGPSLVFISAGILVVLALLFRR